jgi:hypothetical protein
MRRKWLIFLATTATLAIGLTLAWPRIDFWMLTGSLSPIRIVETLDNPVTVTKWNATGLLLADGRTAQLPGVSALPDDSPALHEAIKRGVEVRKDGRIRALVQIHHWCGNDPVREHIAQVDLSEMMTFLRIGKSSAPDPETEILVKEPGGSFSEFGWNISEFMQFQAWESSRRQRADTSDAD